MSDQCKLYVSAYPFNSSFRSSILECLSTSSNIPWRPSTSGCRLISFPSLNLSDRLQGSLDVLANIFVSIFIVWRAFDGRKVRNNRAGFALGEKGLKTALTSVINLVIMSNLVLQLIWCKIVNVNSPARKA